MRWGDMRSSENIEDRGSGGGGGGMPFGGGLRLGGGATILIIIVSLIFGINPLQFLGMGGGDGPPVQQQAAPQPVRPASTKQDPQRDLVARVVGDTEDVWSALFQAMGSRYEPPKLDFFQGSVTTACGRATSSAGPPSTADRVR